LIHVLSRIRPTASTEHAILRLVRTLSATCGLRFSPASRKAIFVPRGEKFLVIEPKAAQAKHLCKSTNVKNTSEVTATIHRSGELEAASYF
jgi:hypothetical protein